MLPYFDLIMAIQLKDCAIAVFSKKERFSLSEVFSCELKLVIHLLKFFKRFRELDYFTKQRFKSENPINGLKQIASFVAFVCQQICRIFQMKS